MQNFEVFRRWETIVSLIAGVISIVSAFFALFTRKQVKAIEVKITEIKNQYNIGTQIVTDKSILEQPDPWSKGNYKRLVEEGKGLCNPFEDGLAGVDVSFCLERRFHYDSGLPLHGRAAEMTCLRNFCCHAPQGSEKDFAWYAISGAGATGKTRLAHELLKEMKEKKWRCAIVKDSYENRVKGVLGHIAEEGKHLIVLDYIKGHTQNLRSWLGLFGEASHQKKAVLRVLLVERNPFGDALRDVEGQYKDSLMALQSLSGTVLRELIEAFADRLCDPKINTEGVYDKNRLEVEHILTTLKGVDGENPRPLFAMILTDALLANEKITGWALPDALNYVWDHECKRIIRACSLENLEGKSAFFLRLLMIATLSLGADYAELQEKCQWVLEKIWEEDTFDDAKKKAKLARVLDTFRGDRIRQLEPDLVGEYFSLKELERLQGDDEKKRCIEAAQALDERDAAVVAGRIVVDFGQKKDQSGQSELERLGLTKYFIRIAIVGGTTQIHASQYAELDQVEVLDIPDTVTEIGADAFRDCKNLRAVTIQSGSKLKAIGFGAFRGCTSLKEVGLPDGLESIGPVAFLGCKNLQEIVLPGTLTAIGARAFEGCSLQNVKVPHLPMEGCGRGAFYGCSPKFKCFYPRKARNRLIGGKGYAFGAWGWEKLAVGDRLDFGGREWDVLDRREKDGKEQALLLAREIVELRVYDAVSQEEWMKPEYGTSWAACSLQKYLNGDFFAAFSKEEKKRIDLTTNENRPTIYTTASGKRIETDGGDPTQDWIFLLSLDEIRQYFLTEKVSAKALASNEEEEKIVSEWYPESMDYAQDLIATRREADAYQASWWWLRSPGLGSDCAAVVGGAGRVRGNGSNVDSNAVGVRPALWLNLSSNISSSGAA
ncbi:MAG: leucine-rich repeat domain-containing protein [Oscillospiraceae bacterium]|jgi:hypothetical protein|nr:leucine-rich repeat domain-containing protein [Oscillospiraceae bacterium]